MKVATRTKVVIPLGTDRVPVIFASFEGLSEDKEHVALIFGEPEKQSAPIVRVHSECLTGDIFGSKRCDCGEQLAEAQEVLSEESGVLLYLRQEGRGIGLYNKLDAYRLQDDGIDTYTANEMLGFEQDLRDFAPAVEMLTALGISKIRLLSNNPDKVKQLQDAGIEVVERLPTGVYLNEHNEKYLQAKKDQHNHSIDLDQGDIGGGEA